MKFPRLRPLSKVCQKCKVGTMYKMPGKTNHGRRRFSCDRCGACEWR